MKIYLRYIFRLSTRKFRVSESVRVLEYFFRVPESVWELAYFRVLERFRVL